MNYKKLFLSTSIVVLVTFLAGSLFAFGSNRRGAVLRDFIEYRVDQELDRLDLTKEQQTKVEAVRQKIRKEVQSIIQQKQQSKKQMLQEWSKDNPDREYLQSLLDRKQDLQKQAAETIMDLMLDFHDVLTKEQRKQLIERIHELQTNRDF
ncbi:Spy/CpxP family protein refolding chaperone [candidate division CSSED10-310 bacterium]|uniref:Spy/CpxP family protein refolding chaperone n=1 Tax=candidate division CSSED10-310 bacterium TaxID=2855610 RepID=A0ABV6Z097_UNCC1